MKHKICKGKIYVTTMPILDVLKHLVEDFKLQFIEKAGMNIKARFALWVLNINVFSKKGIRNSQSNMQTSSISPQNRTKILSLQIRRDGTCVKKYFSLLAQSYTWVSTSIQGFG